MVFSTSCSNIELTVQADVIVHTSGGNLYGPDTYVLNARYNFKDGGWMDSGIVLNPLFGWEDKYKGLSMNGSLADNPCLKPGTAKLIAGGSIFVAKFDDKHGGGDASICLDFFIDVEGGALVCKKPPAHVKARLTRLQVDQHGVMSGFALTDACKLVPTKLALGEHFENDDGVFRKKKNGHFESSSRRINFDIEWTFVPELMDKYGHYGRIQCYQLMDSWVSISGDGEMTLEDPYGPFDLRGTFFRMLEEIPFVGFIVAGVDALAHDSDEANRALAECYYTTYVLAAGLVGGALGGPIGAAVASALGGFVGMYLEKEIGENIKDPQMRKETTTITIYRIMLNELFILSGAGLDFASEAFMGLLTDEIMALGYSGLLTDMATWLGKKGLNALSEKDFKLIVDTLLTAIQEGLSEDDIRNMLRSDPVDPDGRSRGPEKDPENDPPRDPTPPPANTPPPADNEGGGGYDYGESDYEDKDTAGKKTDKQQDQGVDFDLDPDDIGYVGWGGGSGQVGHKDQKSGGGGSGQIGQKGRGGAGRKSLR